MHGPDSTKLPLSSDNMYTLALCVQIFLRPDELKLQHMTHGVMTCDHHVDCLQRVILPIVNHLGLGTDRLVIFQNEVVDVDSLHAAVRCL